jgi:hypothetical protein
MDKVAAIEENYEKYDGFVFAWPDTRHIQPQHEFPA